MNSEPVRIFDPRRNVQLQGFTGRGATTALHDASATGVSISGIFQATEDFAVLGLYNAYDYFNHLRLDVWEHRLEDRVTSNVSIAESEREALVRAPRGQGLFKLRGANFVAL